MSRPLCPFLAVLFVAACGSPNPPTPPPVDEGMCASKGIVQAVSADRTHLHTCQELCGNGLNPPTSGPHCSITSACRVFTTAEPMCQWIHNLEHGHVVLLYNCPEGCPEIVEALTSVWEEAPSPKRILVTPWPGLERKVAAVVWGASWSGDEVDSGAIDCILARQDQGAPEPGLGCIQ